jgi:hypothetical protein
LLALSPSCGLFDIVRTTNAVANESYLGRPRESGDP